MLLQAQGQETKYFGIKTILFRTESRNHWTCSRVAHLDIPALVFMSDTSSYNVKTKTSLGEV